MVLVAVGAPVVVVVSPVTVKGVTVVVGVVPLCVVDCADVVVVIGCVFVADVDTGATVVVVVSEVGELEDAAVVVDCTGDCCVVVVDTVLFAVDVTIEAVPLVADGGCVTVVEDVVLVGRLVVGVVVEEPAVLLAVAMD